LTAWSNRTYQYALANLISRNALAKLLNHTNWLVTDHQTRRDWIFAPDDVQVRSTNRGQRHTDHGFTHSGSWFFNFFHTDIVVPVKNVCFHFFHRRFLM